MGTVRPEAFEIHNKYIELGGQGVIIAPEGSVAYKRAVKHERAVRKILNIWIDNYKEKDNR